MRVVCLVGEFECAWYVLLVSLNARGMSEVKGSRLDEECTCVAVSGVTLVCDTLKVLVSGTLCVCVTYYVSRTVE